MIIKAFCTCFIYCRVNTMSEFTDKKVSVYSGKVYSVNLSPIS